MGYSSVMNWVKRLFFTSPQALRSDPGIPDDWAMRHEDAENHRLNEQFYKQARERQLEHEETVEFETRMKTAMDRYRQFRSAGDYDASDRTFLDLDEPDLRVTWLRNRLSPANHYGIHFRDTDEFGLCESFHFGDGTFSTTYRRVSDDTFERDLHLQLFPD